MENCLQMKKLRIPMKIHFPNIIIYKRVAILVIFFILSFVIISWKREIPKLYDKWRFERYVGNNHDYSKLNNQRNQTKDYLLPLLAQIISDKQAVARICDELEIESCISISR